VVPVVVDQENTAGIMRRGTRLEQEQPEHQAKVTEVAMGQLLTTGNLVVVEVLGHKDHQELQAPVESEARGFRLALRAHD
jgi:hypothetical protein